MIGLELEPLLTSMADAGDSTREEVLGPAAFVALLKTCADRKDFCTGSKLHADIAKRGLLETNVYVGSTLVNMYAKCGELAKAQEVFDELPMRNTVSWTALIAGYAQNGQGDMALKCFERMKVDGFSPDAVTLVCLLRACSNVGATDMGHEIHSHILKEGLLGKNLWVANALVDMYVKCGAIKMAQKVFNKIPLRDVISWTALIAGYAHLGQVEALHCFEQMQQEGFSPNAVTFVCILNACGSLRAASKGQEIHADIVKEGLLSKNILVGNALVDMYAKCGALGKAKEVFDELPVRDVVSWTALIAGYAQYGYGEEAFKYFELMQREGLDPNAITYVCILKACGSIGALEKGQQIHSQIVRKALLENNHMLGPALIDMYAKCGEPAKAQEVFNELPVRDIVCYNVLISAYAEHGHGEEALTCFEEMKCDGISPNSITYIGILKACGSIRAGTKGEEIHSQILKEDLLENDCLLGSALVDMYAKCGLLAKAQREFDKLPVRSVISWTALLAGYAHHGYGEEALSCFERMQHEGTSPNAVTFICALKACGSVGAVSKGQQIHAEVVDEGVFEGDSLVGTSVVDMYAKCGALAKAQEVFDKLPKRDAIAWNALITGYAQLGNSDAAFGLFGKMAEEGTKPDSATFSILLNTCCHLGLIEEGQMCFRAMHTNHGIVPTLEHHACVVDLYGRAGLVGDAISMIKGMPYSADSTMWRILLSACGRWGNVNVGNVVFEHVVDLDANDAAAYVCMSNIYAASGMAEGESTQG